MMGHLGANQVNNLETAFIFFIFRFIVDEDFEHVDDDLHDFVMGELG